MSVRRQWHLPKLGTLAKKMWRFLWPPFFLRPRPMSVRVLVLGPRGAGKTTYLARYYQYLREYMGEGWNAFSEEEESRKYLEEVLEAISQGKVTPTEEPVPLHMTAVRQKDGRSFVSRLHTLDWPGGEQVPQELLQSAQGILFLLDPLNLSPKLASEMEAVLFQLRKRSPRPPVAVVFTKLDHPEAPLKLHSEEATYTDISEQARYFAKEELPSVHKLLTQEFPHFFFSLSAFGDWQEKEVEGKTVLVPDPTKPPLGLHLPFEWLFDTLESRKKKLSQLIWIALALGLGAALLFWLLGA